MGAVKSIPRAPQFSVDDVYQHRDQCGNSRSHRSQRLLPLCCLEWSVYAKRRSKGNNI